MTTVRQIERCWTSKSYAKLFLELIAARPEGLYRLEPGAARAPLAAAMAVIRLDELTQSHVPLCSRLVRAILTAQEADGDWGDPATTALCVRALQCGRGDGMAVQRGLTYLANLQKSEGIWPNLPLRRMPADPHASAFILLQLGDDSGFRQAVRLAEAVQWFQAHGDELDEETRQLWDRARVRCRPRIVPQSAEAPEVTWSRVA